MLSILLVLKTGGTYENEKNKSSGAGTDHVLPGAVDNIPSASGILRGTGTSVPAGYSAA